MLHNLNKICIVLTTIQLEIFYLFIFFIIYFFFLGGGEVSLVFIVLFCLTTPGLNKDIQFYV